MRLRLNDGIVEFEIGFEPAPVSETNKAGIKILRVNLIVPLIV